MYPVSASASLDPALNGRFAVTSNGQWAQTNDIYRDEATVKSTWTITSTCTDPEDCSGTVVSDKGWNAPISKTSNTWVIDRDIPSWEPCHDGRAATGHQQYRFYRVDRDGEMDLTNRSTTFAGIDRTVGPSGACGINRWLAIKMPLRVDQLT
jgi:hypothetical protein